MIVVDTNVIAYFLIEGDTSYIARQVRETDAEWIVPPLWRSEMRNVVMLYVNRGTKSLSEAQEDMRDAELLLRGKESMVESARVLELAAESRCTAYDCEFVALAEGMQARLITSDKKVLAAFPNIAQSMSDFVAGN